MREVNGRMVMRFLDPRSSKIFMDPYFMLQQNDFIITRDYGYKNFLNSYNNWGPLLSLLSTAVGLASTVFTVMIFQNTRNN